MNRRSVLRTLGHQAILAVAAIATLALSVRPAQAYYYFFHYRFHYSVHRSRRRLRWRRRR